MLNLTAERAGGLTGRELQKYFGGILAPVVREIWQGEGMVPGLWSMEMMQNAFIDALEKKALSIPENAFVNILPEAQTQNGTWKEESGNGQMLSLQEEKEENSVLPDVDMRQDSDIIKDNVEKNEGGDIESLAIQISEISYPSRKLQHILLNIRKVNTSITGILFEVSEDELFAQNTSFELLQKVEECIIDSILNLWAKMDFTYAFCDSEADIEFSSVELERKNAPVYSLVIQKNKDNAVDILKGPWCINGLTSRE